MAQKTLEEADLVIEHCVGRRTRRCEPRAWFIDLGLLGYAARSESTGEYSRRFLIGMGENGLVRPSAVSKRHVAVRGPATNRLRNVSSRYGRSCVASRWAGRLNGGSSGLGHYKSKMMAITHPKGVFV